MGTARAQDGKSRLLQLSEQQVCKWDMGFFDLTAMPKILINVLSCNDEGQHSHVAHSPLLSAAGPRVLLHHHPFHAPHYARGKFSYPINGTEESRKYMEMDEGIC